MDENEFNTEEFADDDIETAKDAKKTLRRFLRSVGKQKLRLAIVLFSVAFYSFVNIIAPLYSARVVDFMWERIKALRAVGESFSITWEDGGRQILILLLIYLLSGVFYILQNFLMSSFAERLSYQLRSEAADKLNRLPLFFFDRHRPGEVMSNITNDLDKVSEALQTGMLRLFISFGTVIGSIIMMFTFSWVLTLVFLGFAAISFALANLVSKRTLRYALERQKAVGKITGLTEESYSGRAVIKAFNYEKKSSARIGNATERLARAAEKADFLMNAVNPGIRLVNRCGLVTVAIIGGGMLLSGAMSPGIFQAFFQ